LLFYAAEKGGISREVILIKGRISREVILIKGRKTTIPSLALLITLMNRYEYY